MIFQSFTKTRKEFEKFVRKLDAIIQLTAYRTFCYYPLIMEFLSNVPRIIMDSVRQLYVRQPEVLQEPERVLFEGYISDLWGKGREDFKPQARFEFRTDTGKGIDTPVLDYLVAEIGFLDAYATDADLPPTLPSGEFVYRNAGALERLASVTLELVQFDAYPHSGPSEAVATFKPLPLFEDPSYRMPAFRHREYLGQLLGVLQKNPGAWFVSDRGSIRVADHSRITTVDHIRIDEWQEISFKKIPLQGQAAA